MKRNPNCSFSPQTILALTWAVITILVGFGYLAATGAATGGINVRHFTWGISGPIEVSGAVFIGSFGSFYWSVIAVGRKRNDGNPFLPPIGIPGWAKIGALGGLWGGLVIGLVIGIFFFDLREMETCSIGSALFGSLYGSLGGLVAGLIEKSTRSAD
jgi:hypothetical protein